ncbi:hypothetical protein PFISCL1PPCAC_3916, partial [Pristionchus fissidentatus]
SANISRRVDYEPHADDPEKDLAYEREQRNRARTASDATEDVPSEVAVYLMYFCRCIEEENVDEVRSLYEHGCAILTEHFFRERMWPDEHHVETIADPGRKQFIILCKEFYYRQLYARSQRGCSLVHRYGSFIDYQVPYS